MRGWCVLKGKLHKRGTGGACSSCCSGWQLTLRICSLLSWVGYSAQTENRSPLVLVLRVDVNIIYIFSWENCKKVSNSGVNKWPELFGVISSEAWIQTLAWANSRVPLSIHLYIKCYIISVKKKKASIFLKKWAKGINQQLRIWKVVPSCFLCMFLYSYNLRLTLLASLFSEISDLLLNPHCLDSLINPLLVRKLLIHEISVSKQFAPLLYMICYAYFLASNNSLSS